MSAHKVAIKRPANWIVPFEGLNPSHLIRDLLGQVDGDIAQHALGRRVGDVLQGALQDQGLVVRGLVDLGE